MHDIGKYSPKWQAYIRGEGEQIPHSYAGACELDKWDPDGRLFGLFKYMLQYAISWHHTKLPDMLELLEYDHDYNAYKKELTFSSFLDVVMQIAFWTKAGIKIILSTG